MIQAIRTSALNLESESNLTKPNLTKPNLTKTNLNDNNTLFFVFV